jgi:hypothetical protein
MTLTAELQQIACPRLGIGSALPQLDHTEEGHYGA